MDGREVRTWPGRPYPLGATWDGEGVNFAIFSENATAVELCLFDGPDSAGENHGALDGVLQLAHVPGPVVAAEDRQGRGRDRFRLPFELSAVFLDEVSAQDFHVLLPLA